MHTQPEISAMMRDLLLYGLDPEQSRRFDQASAAAKSAVLLLLRAKHGLSASALVTSPALQLGLIDEAGGLIERMEQSPGFLAHLFSGEPF